MLQAQITGGRQSAQGQCAEASRCKNACQRDRGCPHGGPDDQWCGAGASTRTGDDGRSTGDASAPFGRRLRPWTRSAAALPNGRRTQGAPSAAGTRLRGRKVKLVCDRRKT